MSDIYKGHESLADMVSTHIENWREALTKMKINSFDDDKGYWEHELKALKDIENAVNYDLSK